MDIFQTFYFTALIERVSSTFKLSSSLSFVLLNSILLFLSGDQLGKLTAELHNSLKAGRIGVLLFFTCFPVIFCFFAPVYSFDDFLQFLLINVALRSLHRSKWGLFSVTIGLAIFTRESTLLVLPLLWLFVSENKRKQLVYSLIPGTLLTLIFWGYHFFDSRSTLSQRIHCLEFNFSDWTHSI
jgi:hypothetical protein